MRIILSALVVFLCLTLVVPTAAFAKKQVKEAKESTLGELVSELKKGGVSDDEIDDMQSAMENMLTEGATKKDIKTVAFNLVRMGLHGRDLSDSIKSMDSLIRAGESPKNAGNAVSQAAHDAKARGLKGKELAAEVHKAIAERKRAREKEKKEKSKSEGKSKKHEDD